MSIDLTLSTKALRDWAVEHRIEERAISSFWKCVRNYQVSNQRECLRAFGQERLAESEFTVVVTHISLTLADWPVPGYSYITALVPIVYAGVERGTYRAVFTPAGEDEDDYFGIDPI